MATTMARKRAFNRKKRFVRLEVTSRADTHFETDSALRRLTERVRAGQRFWRTLTDGSDDDSRPNDFEGFGDKSDDKTTAEDDDNDDDDKHSTHDDCLQTTRVARLQTDRIQQLLRSQWEDRIRQLTAREERPPVILRKARLHVDGQRATDTSWTTELMTRDNNERKVERKSDAKRDSKSGHAGVITCAICNEQKYYAHVQRRYGVFSCERCAKFFSRFLRDPKMYLCSKSGDCVVGRSARCTACWLKVCLQKYSIDSDLRTAVSHFAPKLMTQPNCALITVDTSETETISSKRQSRDARQSAFPSIPPPKTGHETPGLLMLAPKRASGPRVKRVCRSQRSVGLSRARFPTAEDDLSFAEYLFGRATADHVTSCDDCEAPPKRRRYPL